jgi:hypothetical protein
VQLNSYLCYSHVLRALSPEVIATVSDYVRAIMPDTLDAYATLKHVLITRFSPTQIDNCFKHHHHHPGLLSSTSRTAAIRVWSYETFIVFETVIDRYLAVET